MPTDIEIARSVTPLPITEVAKNAGVDVKHLIPYGFDKAKVDYSLLNEPTDHQAKLVLVTAINPTPAGEGKTTTTIGLADGLRRRGVKSAVALREPSLGPVFGVKGGAAGGGWAQVIPMEDINLHFTGDFHAIGAANNLLAAMLDNHIQQGNQLGIDVKRITWKRVVDMNDRQLRHVIDGIGGKAQGVPREDGFDITVASEVMAILCLSTSINDLKERLGEIVVGYSYAGEPVRARDLKAQGAMAALLKDALKPNLVQTLEGTPAFVHGGPFANIAHGCNSVQATKMALKMAVPGGIKSLIKPVDEAIRILNNPKASQMRILVLTRTVKDALKIRKNVGEIGFLNVGNTGRFDGIDVSEKLVLTPTIMLTDAEQQALKELVALDPKACMQQVPNDEQKLVKDVLDKLN